MKQYTDKPHSMHMKPRYIIEGELIISEPEEIFEFTPSKVKESHGRQMQDTINFYRPLTSE